MKPDSKIPEAYSAAVATAATSPNPSDEVVRLLTSILRRVKDERFVQPELGPEALKAARSYDRLCSSLDHETELLSSVFTARK